MLTGKNPGYHRLPIASDQPPSLFTELGAAYKTHAIETATRMCPGSVCPGGSGPTQPGFGTRFHSLVSDLRVVSEHLLLPGALARNLPPIGQTVGGFGNSLGEPQGDQGSPTVDARYQQDYDAKLRRERRNATPGGKAEMFSQFVAPIGGAPRNLYFLDIQLPHFPWEYVQTAQQYPQHFPDMDNFVIDDPPGRFIRNRWLVDQSYARHMLQAGATDKLLGTLIRRMKQAGIWDKALITVSADHGVSFHPGGFRREVKAANLADIAFVPLFVKAPGQNAAREVDRHTCTTDIPGLITRALGVEIPWHADRCDPDRIAVLDSFGGTRDGELARAEARRAATVRRKFTLFGEGWAGVYGFGPAPELIGKQVKAFQPEPARRNRIRFDEQSDVSDVDPRGAIVPALLQATINFVKAPAAGLPLAVAVNGRIAATTRAYELRGKNRFIALLEPRFYRPGRNSVEVFTISGSRRPRLESLGGVNLR
jgi:hypothetical protein